MKISENYIMRQIAGEYIIVPTGRAAMDFKGLISLNEVGAFLWRLMQEKEQTMGGLLDAVCEEYETDREQAEKDISEFIEKIRREGMLSE